MPPSSTQILPSRKPEPYIKTTCKKCMTPLEFLPAVPVPNANVQVLCWACNKVVDFTLDAQGKGVRGTDKKNIRKIGTDENPISTEYYDLLGVPPTANATEIKKKYRQLAFKYHPDKNPDPTAEEQFKFISEAYQVLSDPLLRKRYNEHGAQKNLTPEGGFVNPEDFFKQQFGGDRFTDIIGEISMGRDMKEAMQGEDASEEDGNITEEEKSKKERQKQQSEKERLEARARRVDTLAANLIHKLNHYVELAESPSSASPAAAANATAIAAVAFHNTIQAEAEELKAESYGVQLLHAIGYTYSLKARQHLARNESVFSITGLTGYWHTVREKSHILGETVSTLRSAIDLQNSFTQLQEAEKRGDMTEEEKSRLEEMATQKGLQAMWCGSKLEVESVLRDVCDKVLSDPKVSKETLRRRVEALKIIGSVYENVQPDEVREAVPAGWRASASGPETFIRQANGNEMNPNNSRRETTTYN